MTAKRTWLTVTRRIGAHGLSVACVAAVAILAVYAPGDAPGAASIRTPARLVDVIPGETTLVCPSPAELLQEDVGDDQFDASPVETASELTVAAGTHDVVGLDGATPRDGAAPVVRAEPGILAAATATSVTTAGDLRGLIAGPCQAPTIEHWLVGGSSDVGSSSRLILQNPGRTAASVSLEVWGPSGPIALGGQALVVVPAGGQVSTTLEAVAPEQSRFVVHAVSQGARVNAYLQHHRIDGLVPQGADLVPAGAAPSSALAVTGVDSREESVDDPHAPAVRLLAPGDRDGTARLSVYGADGRIWPRGLDEVDLPAGTVTDIPLGGLPKGQYTVVADATVPVVGGGLVHRRGEVPEDSVIDEAPYDTAWIAGQAVRDDGAMTGVDSDGGPAAADDAGAEPVGGAGSAEGGTGDVEPASSGLLAVPDGVSWAVDLAAVPAERGDDDDPTGSAAVTVTGYASDGSETGTLDVEIPAGTNLDLSGEDLEPLGEKVAAISLASAGDVAVPWAIRLADGSLIATLTPPETAMVESRVAVRDVVAD